MILKSNIEDIKINIKIIIKIKLNLTYIYTYMYRLYVQYIDVGFGPALGFFPWGSLLGLCRPLLFWRASDCHLTS